MVGRASTCRYIVPPLTTDDVSPEKYTGVLDAIPPVLMMLVNPESRACLRLVGVAGVGTSTEKLELLESYPFDFKTTLPVTAPEGTCVFIVVAVQPVNTIASTALVNVTLLLASNDEGHVPLWQK